MQVVLPFLSLRSPATDVRLENADRQALLSASRRAPALRTLAAELRPPSSGRPRALTVGFRPPSSSVRTLAACAGIPARPR